MEGVPDPGRKFAAGSAVPCCRWQHPGSGKLVVFIALPGSGGVFPARRHLQERIPFRLNYSGHLEIPRVATGSGAIGAAAVAVRLGSEHVRRSVALVLAGRSGRTALEPSRDFIASLESIHGEACPAVDPSSLTARHHSGKQVNRSTCACADRDDHSGDRDDPASPSPRAQLTTRTGFSAPSFLTVLDTGSADCCGKLRTRHVCKRVIGITKVCETH